MVERFWQRFYDYTMPTTIRYPHISIPDLLLIPANVQPDKPAIIYEGAEISFYELRQLSLSMAAALEDLGVKKGERIGLHLPNCPQYLIAYYAALTLGAIIVGLNPSYPLGELLTIVKNTDLKTVFTLDETAERIDALTEKVALERIIVGPRRDYGRETVHSLNYKLKDNGYSFYDLVTAHPEPRHPHVQVETTDPAIIQFTGGTTGVPKGAVLSHANMIAAVMQTSPRMYPLLQFIPPERRKSLLILPLYHVYGNLIANWSLFNCVSQILVPRFQVDKVIDLLLKVDEITYFPTVPTMLTALANHPRIKELNLGRKVHVINSGAAPCPVELIERLRDMGVFVTEAWGMSETSSIGIMNPILGKRKPGSIGLPAPDNDIRIVDVVDGETEVPRGQPGELLIKGPTVMIGYWNNPEETAEVLKDGWLHTGDIVVQDEDGFLFIVDRKKDMIIAGGFNVYPREIEEVLYRHPQIKEAVAVGIPDPYRGETVKVFIVPRGEEELTEGEILAFCREHLAPYKVPKEVEFRSSLPQSAVGKVLRKVLREEEMEKRYPKSGEEK